MVNFALQTPGDAAPAAQRASGTGIVLAGDRSREFRRARWHSVLIRILRAGLPLASLAVAGLFVRMIIETSGYGNPAVVPKVSITLDKEITMDNPRYEGFSKDGGSYTVTAKTAIPDLANPSLVKLNSITGEFYDARKSRTDLTATRGLFDNKTNRLDLSDGIDVVTQTGMHAKLRTVTIMTKDGTIVSQVPVEIDMPSGRITSNQMSLNQKTRDATFLEAVKAHLIQQVKPTPAAAEPAAAESVVPPPAAAAQSFGHANAPVDVTSDRLDIHDGAKTATFTGHVHAIQLAAGIETETLEVSYEGGNGAGLAAPIPADPAAPATKIKLITAPGPVVLTQGTGERVSGDNATFDAASETAVVTGNVVVTSGPDRRATAGRVEFRQKADTFLLTGNVVVTQARNELRGRHLTVDRKSGKTELISPADGALAKSRIFARLYQGDGKATSPAKTATATAAKAAVTEAAAAATGGFTSFKTDPNAPVDIEADRLNADDTKKTAIFTGDVKAAQGEFIIRTVELVATYSGEAGLANLTPAPGTAAPAKTPAQLTRIDAHGKVIVTSKAGQEVTGDTAVFDTKANTVLVSGKEVILTQDKSVVRCNKLMIEMTTGQSNCLWEAATGASASAPAAPGGLGAVNAASHARPSVLFYPAEHQKPGSPPKPPPAAKPAASSWESSTAPSPN